MQTNQNIEETRYRYPRNDPLILTRTSVIYIRFMKIRRTYFSKILFTH
jgi:hypothetical protein